MAIDRLIGADASLYSVSFGTTVTSGTLTSGSWYQIVSISGTGVFPSGYQAGDLFYATGQSLTAGNSAAPATFSPVLDCTSFEFNFSAGEVDVTTLLDGVKKYRKGKVDLQGTINGINLVSQLKQAGSFLNKFIRVANVPTSGAATLNAQNSSALYIKAYMQDDATTGETEVFLFGQVELYGFKLGAAIGDAQSYSSGVRFIGADPIVYTVAH